MKKGLKRYSLSDFDKKRKKNTRELKEMISNLRARVDSMGKRLELRRNG